MKNFLKRNRFQVEELFLSFDRLQGKHGDREFLSIYGGGKIEKPRMMYIFMNPTGRNVASKKNWRGIRAPWIGTKQVWRLFRDISLISDETLSKVVKLKSYEWTEEFSYWLYKTISESDSYITNFAKCTLKDARPLSNTIFREYKGLLLKEIKIINPMRIVTFGNQVSSLLLDKSISVSDYLENEYEILKIGSQEYKIYPTYYPVGQGQRNMPLSKKRLLRILNKKG